jgi:hypothetical protein
MIDAYSETWREMAAKANGIIEASRTRLEQVDQSQSESQFLRGKIAALREILALAQPRSITASDRMPDELRPRDRSGI